MRLAFRHVCRKTHPDKGGSLEDQKKLNAAHDAWTEAARARTTKGRSAKASRQSPKAPANEALACDGWSRTYCPS